LVDLLGRNPRADLDRHGAEFEAEFRKVLESFEGKEGRAGKASSALSKENGS
jgi:hypothetical protein